MMSRYFLFLLICHFRWIGWRGNPTLEAVIRKGLVIIIGKKEFVGQISLARNSLEEPAPTLLLQN
jgi:deoxycytidine triphosphate deaminase